MAAVTYWLIRVGSRVGRYGRQVGHRQGRQAGQAGGAGRQGRQGRGDIVQLLHALTVTELCRAINCCTDCDCSNCESMTVEYVMGMLPHPPVDGLAAWLR